MPRMRATCGRAWSSIHRVTAVLRAHSKSILLATSVVAIGVIVGAIASYVDTGDRLLIGNTAGSLSILAEIEDHRVLIGAGPTRSHAADFVGRSTRPWDREIDLLVLPGWDAFHATGALGLLERREVSGIAVIGIPDEEPIWAMLEREAQRQDIPVRFLEQPHRLDSGNGAEFTMIDLGSRGETGSWVRLEYHGARFDIVDVSGETSAALLGPFIDPGNDHVVINARLGNVPDGQEPVLLARPEPFHHRDFEEDGTGYIANVSRNERVVLRLSEREVRISLDEIDVRN